MVLALPCRSDPDGHLQDWHIFVLAALLGVVERVRYSGTASFLVDMVGKEDLMNAIALNSSIFNGARMSGPAVAGILVAASARAGASSSNARELHRRDRRAADDASSSPGPSVTLASARWRTSSRASAWCGRAPIRALLVLLGLVSLVGDAVHRADAGFRRPDLARRSERSGYPDGRHGRGRAAGSATLAAAPACDGFGTLGGVLLRRLRVSLVLFAFFPILAFGALLIPAGFA